MTQLWKRKTGRGWYRADAESKSGATYETKVVTADTAGGPAAPDYGAMTKDELQAEAERRKLEVKGTGKDGAVVKADLVAALTAAD